VQPLLDGVLSYLPCPLEVSNYALDQTKDEEKVFGLTTLSQFISHYFPLKILIKGCVGCLVWNSRWTTCGIGF